MCNNFFLLTGSSLCPVDMFQLYVSKLNPGYKYFWQRPKRAANLHYTDPIWYDKIRVGHQPIEEFMSRLSKQAGLSKRYTNHSIRSTVMGILGERFEGRHVIGLSGHKSESTIKQYVTRLPEKKKREMSEALSTNVQPDNDDATPKFQFKKPKKTSATATVSKPPDNSETPDKQNPEPAKNPDQVLPVLQLEEIDDAPNDDILINLLNQLESQQAQQQMPPPPVQVLPTEPLQQVLPNNTMNISNVSNVQNVNANHRMMPSMYFGGHSNVVINYNFGPQKEN